MIIEFVQQVRSDLDRAMMETASNTGAGGASSWEDYQRRVGIVTGLQRARTQIDEVFRQFIDDKEI